MSPAAQGFIRVPRAMPRAGLESDVRPRVPLRSTPGLPEVHLARRASCAAPSGSRLRRDAPRAPARPPLSRAARRLGRSPAQDFVGFPALQGPFHRPGHPRQGHAREKRPGMPLATSVAPEAQDPPQLSGSTTIPSLSPGLSPPGNEGARGRDGRSGPLFPEILLKPCEKREGSRPNPAADSGALRLEKKASKGLQRSCSLLSLAAYKKHPQPPGVAWGLAFSLSG